MESITKKYMSLTSKMEKLTPEETIVRYENFINNVLKEDLKQLESKLKEYNNEATDLIQQKHTLKVITNKKMHPTGFKTQINLGCNFFMEASVLKTDMVLIKIGLNYYVEYKLSEANKYLEARIKMLENLSEDVRVRAAQVSAHIKLMLHGISELQNQIESASTDHST